MLEVVTTIVEDEDIIIQIQTLDETTIDMFVHAMKRWRTQTYVPDILIFQIHIFLEDVGCIQHWDLPIEPVTWHALNMEDDLSVYTTAEDLAEAMAEVMVKDDQDVVEQ